ncbi:hypothetical protein MWH28_12600 [Natroniella sulfidigena]|nr:hypothetical protein [Natroniella sulfidigena]MCK8818197.1 hypothetical protein [Natroniella sulfidigena]
MKDKKIYELHADMCKVLAHAKRIEIIYLLKEGSGEQKRLSLLLVS